MLRGVLRMMSLDATRGGVRGEEDFYWTWLIDRPPVCTARILRNSPLGDRRDDAR